MKNKFLTVGVLVAIFSFAGNAYAVGQNGNIETGDGNQVQQQTQTANQGEENQIQSQNNEQTQSGTANQAGIEVEAKVQVQQKAQDGTESGSQVQNQGEANQVQAKEQEGDRGQNNAIAEQRRSQVANAVQEMLQVADRSGGIGEQVRVVAQNQNQNQEKFESGLQKIQSRSGFAKFFIGPNYGEINNAQKILEQNREQIMQLDQIKNQLANQGDAQILTQQIQILEQINLQMENSLQNEQKGFSLLGWAFKFFSK